MFTEIGKEKIRWKRKRRLWWDSLARNKNKGVDRKLMGVKGGNGKEKVDVGGVKTGDVDEI